ENLAAAQGTGNRSTTGDRVYVSWRARGSGGVSRKDERSGTVHSVDGAKHAARNRREPAGGILRCVLRPRRVYRRTIETRTAGGPSMGAGSAGACGAAFANGRGATGDPAEGGELRSSGKSKQERHSGAGKIGNRGDAAAGMRFSPGVEGICAGAGAD